MTDDRRVYYDHESVYRRIKAQGGRGWDDRADGDAGSYRDIRPFLDGDGLPAPGATALELGCGGGQVAIELARRGYLTSGIDFSETAIELAQRNACEAGVDVTFAVADALALPFPDATFDLVVDNHLLHCIIEPDDRARVLAGVWRVLVPGGRVWSGTMSAEGDFDISTLGADPSTRVARNYTRIWVRRIELAGEFAAAGLAVVSMAELAHEHGTDLITLARRPG